MPNPTIVEAASAIPNRGTLVITFNVQQDGAAMNLTGKTVTATVRSDADPSTVINAALEDHAVTLVTPASGVCTLTLTTAELPYLSGAGHPSRAVGYLVNLKVMPDAYVPEAYRLLIHGVLD
jgi:hypothetical protein